MSLSSPLSSSGPPSTVSSRPGTPVLESLPDPNALDAWILGSGLASLTAAVHLIRECKVPPHRIHVLEAPSKPGIGYLSTGDAESGYHYRGECIPHFCGGQMKELLLRVPSDTAQSVWGDIEMYFEQFVPKIPPRTRFLARKKNGLERVDGKRLNLGIKDRMDLFVLSSKTESALGRSRIREHFSDGFFRTNYWLTLATMFGFQPSHSAAEFRRFVQHFPHDIQNIHHPRPLDRVRYNFHEAIVAPIARYLEAQRVDFRPNTITTDIIAEPLDNPTRVTRLRTTCHGQPERTIDVGPEDLVFVSLGSVSSGSSQGSNREPPSLEMMEIEKDLDENWLLWLELATKHPKFGNAYNFCTRLHESRVGYFTVTLKDPRHLDRILEVIGDEPETGSLVTLRDSSWLLTLNVPRQPLFPDQPDNVRVFWGYMLTPEKEGEAVKKPMLECSGEEIMTELLHQMGIPGEEILPQSITIPCVMPRMSATLLPREEGDRPRVIPKDMTNLALIGQFVDIPGEMVTMDYMIRGAQMAVHRLMGLDRDLRKSKKGYPMNLLGFRKD
ncbi:oleate hydratase [Aspergillus clavatus NRRL 1]|uniref:67 kDa myosin-cross-reactive antigen family protein n=1 Tax=Aspergillus clavatus (strain ATCC 1007 / CBS 513.65 / DSM 816 / NCTC 3887 / NRRL 1 / QM 1276 / 107) TaxID=344612 RepID=A1CAW2_ASPCL|nr:67 kDa myosin-cross-reactive antigen family protein [Aspergillus clavatus NRRL 1]EAW12880.1 67 kDa myosin-cross-reactive antigen family protein [Aspergillus clavatus NRRL 1]